MDDGLRAALDDTKTALADVEHVLLRLADELDKCGRTDDADDVRRYRARVLVLADNIKELGRG